MSPGPRVAPESEKQLHALVVAVLPDAPAAERQVLARVLAEREAGVYFAGYIRGARDGGGT